MSSAFTTSAPSNNNTMSARGYPVATYDRQMARDMIAAIQYVPTAQETAYVERLERERQERKAAKKARKQYLVSDTASVSSFGSAVGMLKSKFSRKH